MRFILRQILAEYGNRFYVDRKRKEYTDEEYRERVENKAKIIYFIDCKKYGRIQTTSIREQHSSQTDAYPKTLIVPYKCLSVHTPCQY